MNKFLWFSIALLPLIAPLLLHAQTPNYHWAAKWDADRNALFVLTYSPSDQIQCPMTSTMVPQAVAVELVLSDKESVTSC